MRDCDNSAFNFQAALMPSNHYWSTLVQAKYKACNNILNQTIYVLSTVWTLAHLFAFTCTVTVFIVFLPSMNKRFPLHRQNLSDCHWGFDLWQHSQSYLPTHSPGSPSHSVRILMCVENNDNLLHYQQSFIFFCNLISVNPSKVDQLRTFFYALPYRVGWGRTEANL